MELRHLRYFVAVVDAGSITRGAQVVAVAQPSLSRQLRQLEDELGETLFDRSGGRAQLTAAGRVLLPLARDLVGRADRAASIMRGLTEPDRLSLRLVAPETTVADVVAPFLAQLPEGAPVVDVREALPAAVADEVAAGAADLGIISAGPPPTRLTTRLIVRFPIWAYVHAGHRWRRRRSIGLTDLASEPLIVLGSEHGTRRLFDAAMAEAGTSYDTAAETNVPQVAQALAASGRGVAIVSDDARYDLHGVRIRATRGELRVPLFGAWDPSHYGAGAIAELIEALAVYCERRYGLHST